MNTHFLHTEQLTVGYDGKPLIEQVEIGVRRGEILTLIGPNGSGKSTILKTIIRQPRVIAGTVVLEGRDMAGMRENEIAKKMAILMTERFKAELMSCRDVVATGRYPYTGRLGLLSKEDYEIVDRAIATVHAEDFAEKPFSNISDGQRQRLMLARAICQEPEVIVLDEPTSFLDVKHKLELLDILKGMVRERNVAVVMSLHELDLAQKVSDYVVCVAGDRVLRYDTPEQIFRDDVIRELYGIEKGSYNSMYGCLEMERVHGKPKVFVIGGGGSGIALYRRLQRAGIPFAAGVLQQNDLDYPVANALAAECIEVPAFSSISDSAISRAFERMEAIGTAVCTVSIFGDTNAGNRALLERAKELGILTDSDALFGSEVL